MRVVELHDTAGHSEHDHEMVGPDRGAGAGLVAQQAHLDRAHQDRAVRGAQSLHGLGRRAARAPLTRPSEQVEG
ncbi:MAG TPA: hypothetical protein VD903_18410 [Pseudonocardia sp.]|nr:hypothetical protein [Pseudonocardia sp.]